MTPMHKIRDEMIRYQIDGRFEEKESKNRLPWYRHAMRRIERYISLCT